MTEPAFRLSARPLDTASLAQLARDPSAGGYVAFEGWVRNHHEGRPVLRLGYEAFEALALKEGARVLSEACARFALVRALCVHRTGELEIGDVAIWIGVSAHHRDAAFRACRFIIDEVKQRVPVWKKEHYQDGTSLWVNCAACAEPHAPDGHHHG